MISRLWGWYEDFMFWYNRNGFWVMVLLWGLIPFVVTIRLGWENGVWMSLIIGLLFFVDVFGDLEGAAWVIVIGLCGVGLASLGLYLGWLILLVGSLIMAVIFLVSFWAAEVLKALVFKLGIKKTTKTGS